MSGPKSLKLKCSEVIWKKFVEWMKEYSQKEYTDQSCVGPEGDESKKLRASPK